MPRKHATSKHEPFQPAADCRLKRRFRNETEAKNAAEHQMLVKPTLELDVYRCSFCGLWHLTRQIKTNN